MDVYYEKSGKIHVCLV